MRLAFFAFLLIGVLPRLSMAETRYVTDQFEVMMRSGTSTKNSIVRMLPSGAAVEVLQAEPEEGFLRVRTPSGAEGWVLSRYLMRAPAARAQLAAARAQAEEADAQLKQLSQELRSLHETKDDVDTERELLETENRRLNQELEEIREASADVLTIKDQNSTLRQRLNVTERDLMLAKDENKVLLSQAIRDKWITGAGIMLAGILLGIILPRLRWRRRSGDW